ATAVGVFFREVDAAVPDGLVGGGHGELGEAVHPTGLARVAQDHLGLEALDLAAEVDQEGGRVQLGGRADAASPGDERVPVAGHVKAQRVDGAPPGDDDAPGHGSGGLPFYVIDGLADRLEALGLLLGDDQVERLFQLHDQLDDVQRVGADVLLE